VPVTTVATRKADVPSSTRAAARSELPQQRRALFGLRRRPGRLALAVFRIPLSLYRRRWGWLLGRTFLALVHAGRRSGQPHQTVAMVLADDPLLRQVVICSAWGPDADWIKNLRAGGGQQVIIGRERYVPEHRFLNDDEAVEVGVAFRQRHPRRLKLISKILGWGDLSTEAAMRGFVQGHPFVALRPATARAAEHTGTRDDDV
jgi:deazaflavin-dependent oxidoreductase (nitroreductase family)